MTSLVEQPVVLAVGAHPDNVELLAAGTLALLRQRGWRVVVGALTSGDPEPRAGVDGPLGRVRHDQMRRAAGVLDAECVCLEMSEFGVVYSDEACRRVTALVRAVRPALVLTHGPQDATPDHEETSRLLRQACFAAPVQEYTTPDYGPEGAAATGRIPHLYYFDPFELIDVFGRPVDPTLIVEITPAMELKERLLAQYVPDAGEAEAYRGVGWYVDEVRSWAKRRGERIGRTYGEGFRQHVGSPFPRDNLLRDVLGDSVHVLS